MAVRGRFIIGILVFGLALASGAALIVGADLVSPTQVAVGLPPRRFQAEAVEFPSQSGARLKGWLVRRSPGMGAVMLMHGINANRSTMLPRAQFLSNAGYSVLLFDFQANGESRGDHQTFGYLESLDARAACAYLKSRLPNERIGAIGVSLGGAAAILGPSPLDVRALVVEAVYPTIEEATANRIAIRLGSAGRLLTPLLLGQLRPRLGISVDDLRPIERIGAIRAPLLLIAGSQDRDTTPAESRRLFRAAPDPKQYWEISGAGHQDFHLYGRLEYEGRILDFFGRHLRTRQPDAPGSTSGSGLPK